MRNGKCDLVQCEILSFFKLKVKSLLTLGQDFTLSLYINTEQI